MNELPIVPLSASSGEKRNLEVDEEMQQKKQCTSGRDDQLLSLRPPLLDDHDEVLWYELLDLGESVIEEWNDENEDHQVVTTEQLIRGVARRGNERGANVHEKSFEAKDTEWKKLDEKGAVRILTRDSAEKAKTQFSNRVSFQVVLS